MTITGRLGTNEGLDNRIGTYYTDNREMGLLTAYLTEGWEIYETGNTLDSRGMRDN